MNLAAGIKKLINSNFTKPLNEQIRDYSLMPMWLFTGSQSWTPPKKGYYRIICVGKGGAGRIHSAADSGRGGAAGGVVVNTLKLNIQSYSLAIETNADFAGLMSAYGATTDGTTSYAGGGNPGAGGTLYKSNDISGGTYDGGNVAISILNCVAEGGNGYHVSSSNTNSGGGGGFGGGGGGAAYSIGNVGKGGIGFAGGTGGGYANGIYVPPGLGGGTAGNSNVASSGGAAAIFVEFIEETA